MIPLSLLSFVLSDIDRVVIVHFDVATGNCFLPSRLHNCAAPSVVAFSVAAVSVCMQTLQIRAMCGEGMRRLIDWETGPMKEFIGPCDRVSSRLVSSHPVLSLSRLVSSRLFASRRVGVVPSTLVSYRIVSHRIVSNRIASSLLVTYYHPTSTNDGTAPAFAERIPTRARLPTRQPWRTRRIRKTARM